MLRFGFFEDFAGSDTVLIWGDAEGLSDLQQLFADLSMGGRDRVAADAIKGARGLPGVTIAFELGADELRVRRNAGGTAVVACCSAKRFAAFADKVASLVDPNCRNGHHYLDWAGTPDTQIVVSKGEYPEDFGGA